MKKYTTKRVLAGVLAVMTVAGFTPANVGGLMQGLSTGITAEAAATKYDVSFAESVQNCIDGLAYGSQNLDNDTIRQMNSFKITEGETVTLKSYLDLHFNFKEQTAAGGVVEYGAQNSAERGKAITPDAQGQNTFVVVEGYQITLAAADADNGATTTFKSGDKIIIKDQTQFQNKANVNGGQQYEGWTVQKVGLTKEHDSLNKTGNDEDGYTYTFKMPKYAIEATAAATALSIKNGGKWTLSNKTETFEALTNNPTFVLQSAATGTDGTAITAKDNADFQAINSFKNELVTVSADEPFVIHIAKSSGLTAEAGAENGYKVGDAADVVSKYDANAQVYKASFRAPEKLKDINSMIFVAKLNEQFTLGNNDDKTALIGTGKETQTQINMAWVEAEAQAPTKFDDALDPSEWEAEAKAIKTNSENVNGSKVTVSFNRDPHFTSAYSNGATAKFVITKDGKELADTAKVQIVEAYNEQGNVEYAGEIEYADLKKGTFKDALSNDIVKIDKILFTEAGDYEIKYTVNAKQSASSSTDGDMIYKFSIVRRTALTLSNAKLWAYTTTENVLKDAKETYLKIENGKVVDETDFNTNGYTKVYKVQLVKNAAGVYTAKTVGEDLKKATVYVYADLFKATSLKPTTQYSNAQGITFEVSGSTAISTPDSSANASILYYDNEYTADKNTLGFEWMVSAKNLDPMVEPVNQYGVGFEGQVLGWNGSLNYNQTVDGKRHAEEYFIRTTLDTIDTLEEQIMDSILLTNIDEKDISFGYVEGYGADVTKEDELTYHEDGLPTKEGQYSIFIRNNGDDIAAFNLQIKKFAIYGAPTEAQLNLTYGDRLFKAEDLKYVDFKDKSVSTEVLNPMIQVYPATEMTKAQIKKITADNKYQENANYTADVFQMNGKYYYLKQNTAAISLTAALSGDYVQSDGILNAGYYIIMIDGQEGTKIANTDYSLMDRYYPLYIAPKEIRTDMILVKPKTYDGKAQNVTDADVIGTNVDALDNNDQKLPIQMKISSGTKSATNIGAYKVKVAATGVSANNYTGEVEVEWHITPKVVENAENLANMVWDDAATTIYNNGQIHVQCKRPADSSFKGASVKQYGVLIEKDGKIPAPEYDTLAKYKALKSDTAMKIDTGTAYGQDAVKTAYAVLRFGNGLVEGVQNAAMVTKYGSNQIYGANVNVTGVETGAWLRPYILLTDGTVCYGTVRYINLQQEATDKLNLKMSSIPADSYAVTKNAIIDSASVAEKQNKTYRDKIKTGFDVNRGGFYVYGSYTLDENFTGKDTAVKQFGVVVDKSGKFTPDNAAPDANHEVGGKLKTDDTVSVKKGLVLGKKFIEGKAKANNGVYDADEYGALIKPADGVSGVWVRAYVDLGNNLVVYTDPIYIESTSALYAANKPYMTFTNENGAGSKVKMNVAVQNAAATVKSVGVIYDNKGSLLGVNNNGLFEENATWKTAFDGNTVETANRAVSEMVLEKADANGFGKTKRAPKDGAALYSPTLSFTLNEKAVDTGTGKYPFVIRPYVVYTINGNDVTVYGDVYLIDPKTPYNTSTPTDEFSTAYSNANENSVLAALWYFKKTN
jgi:hypothetical protein